MPSDLGVAQPYNFFILGTMNEQNTDVEGRLAVGGTATLMNFGTASAHASATYALVSNTSLNYVNGTIHGDLHYNGYLRLTSVAVIGTTFANTPINFSEASTSLIGQSQFLDTQAATGTVSLQGSTLTLTGSATASLNVFALTSSQINAANHGRLNIANVAPTATVLINVSGTKRM